MNVRGILSIPLSQLTPAQMQTMFSYWRTTVPEWKAANDEIAEQWRQHPEGTSQFVLQEQEEARETHVLQRGDFLKPEATVTAGVPAFLHPSLKPVFCSIAPQTPNWTCRKSYFAFWYLCASLTTVV